MFLSDGIYIIYIIQFYSPFNAVCINFVLFKNFAIPLWNQNP
jgi:hypothetical protein